MTDQPTNPDACSIRLYDQEGNLHVMRVPDTASNRLFGQYLDVADNYPFKSRFVVGHMLTAREEQPK